jgi:SAM-dependent methyltransferase
MELLPIAKGIASYVPGLYAWRSRRRHLRTASAAYCYEVWIKHVTLLNENASVPVPKTFAELGPGGSLGLGLAALLSGADTYYALDMEKYSEIDLSVALLDDLVDLFRTRAPAHVGWPIESDVFPGDILTDNILAETLAEPRIADIRRALTAPTGRAGSITIEYIVPWNDPSVIRRGEVDLIVSHSVLEHVNDLEDTYDAFSQWLRPGGYMSHGIDFRSHGLTKPWNGHWEYPEFVWRVIVGRKPFLINREPCSTHVSLMTDNEFVITRELRRRINGIPRHKLASRWQDMTDDDLVSSGAVVQARLQER